MERKLFVMTALLLAVAAPAAASSWQQKNGEHFIIKYPEVLSEQWADGVLRAAEGYYDSIARSIDYARYNKYWSWEKRVVIVVYPTREAFLTQTGQPEWSQGGAIHRRGPLEERRIVTFYQEEGFLDALLPHEISHLMLLDFMADKHGIPIWFNEGVAQLHEKDKLAKTEQLMRAFIARGAYIPFEVLMGLDVRAETDEMRVAVFYAQSLSVVDFMIKAFGSRRFGALCRAMGAGKDFQEALRWEYPSEVSTLSQLEKSWLSYMKSR